MNPITTVGPYKISLLKQDWFALDAGVLFGGVPKSAWENLPELKWIKRHNIVPLPINVFLIQSPEKNIVVDTGLGDLARWSERTREQFRMKAPESMEGALSRFGLRREDIHAVLHTHLHFDHAGGDVLINERGEMEPMFPNARYVVHADEVAHALLAHPKTRSSYRRETTDGIRFLREHGMLKEMIVSHGTYPLSWIFPSELGISLVSTPGHTDNHYSIFIQSREKTAIIAGATLATRWHAHPAFSIGNDTSPLEGANIKLSMLEKASQEGWTVLFEHDELIYSYVRKIEDGYHLTKITP